MKRNCLSRTKVAIQGAKIIHTKNKITHVSNKGYSQTVEKQNTPIDFFVYDGPIHSMDRDQQFLGPM